MQFSFYVDKNREDNFVFRFESCGWTTERELTHAELEKLIECLHQALMENPKKSVKKAKMKSLKELKKVKK